MLARAHFIRGTPVLKQVSQSSALLTNTCEVDVLIHFVFLLRQCNRFFLFFVLELLTIAGTGCGSVVRASGSPDPAKTLTAVTVSPAAVIVVPGGTMQLAATAKYSDGSTADVSAAASWSSTAASVAVVSPSGLTTGVTAGSATVTAALNGMSGSARISVPQAAKTVKTIALSPATAGVAPGATQQLTATVTYNDGSTADMTSQASWTTSNAA